jgi:putative oxidoreductase
MHSYGPAVLRLAVGAVFVAHGAQKLFGIWGGHGLPGTSAYLASLGLGPAYPLAILLALTEFVGGLMLIFGALTLFVSAALALAMTVAIWKVHYTNGFFLNWELAAGRGHGIEYNVVLIAALVCLALAGPGAFSIDGRRAEDAAREAAGRARLRSRT